jgi:hypothetical protein
VFINELPDIPLQNFFLKNSWLHISSKTYDRPKAAGESGILNI